MSDWVVRCEGLSKRYRINNVDRFGLRALCRSMQDMALGMVRRRSDDDLAADEPPPEPGTWIWALDDVSFTLQQGDILGVIGPNGAGKSTLLKILARLTEPTRGWAQMRGRVASLLEVGTGFHSELTGRENVFLNGAILGMSGPEIKRGFDEIVAFADIGEFIDTQVKHYSSGMHMRLAFSVAAHLNADILLIDEILAVGDAAFHVKCLNKMEGVAKSGRTIIFVSHALDAVTRLCTRGILIDHGRISAEGTSHEVVDKYLAQMHVRFINEIKQQQAASRAVGLTVTETWIENGRGEPAKVVVSGDRVKLVARFETQDGVPDDLKITAIFQADDGNCLFRLAPRRPAGKLPRRGRIEWTIPRFPINSGRFMYSLTAVRDAHDDYFLPAAGTEDDEQNILAAGGFDAEPGDFFATGQIPDEHVLLLMEHGIEVIDETGNRTVLSCGELPLKIGAAV